jgi:hypothetical protein
MFFLFSLNRKDIALHVHNQPVTKFIDEEKSQSRYRKRKKFRNEIRIHRSQKITGRYCQNQTLADNNRQKNGREIKQRELNRRMNFIFVNETER